MKLMVESTIRRNQALTKDIFQMDLMVGELARMAKPGQFLNLYPGEGTMLLPRPISISEIDAEEGVLRVIYQTVGKGTALFSKKKPGQTVRVLGPLGNGFSPQTGAKHHLIVGGGIGVPPLVELAKQLEGTVEAYIGARSEPILVDRLQELGAIVHVATDDGSRGFHGNVVQMMEATGAKGDALYACGPKVMLRFVTKWALENNIRPQVSMEERMACGIGACVGCVVKIKKQGETDWQYRKVCKDGPVFYGDEVVWE